MPMRVRVIMGAGLLWSASAFAAGCRCSTSAPGANEPTPTSQMAPPGPVSATNNHVTPNAMPRFSAGLSPHLIEAMRLQIDADAGAGAASPDGG